MFFVHDVKWFNCLTYEHFVLKLEMDLRACKFMSEQEDLKVLLQW